MLFTTKGATLAGAALLLLQWSVGGASAYYTEQGVYGLAARGLNDDPLLLELVTRSLLDEPDVHALVRRAGDRTTGRSKQQDKDKAAMANLNGQNGAGQHNWKAGAEPGTKKPAGQAATADAERVAHQAMNQPASDGRNQNQDHWQLRGPPHQTPSALPGQNVVTAQQARPGSPSSTARHLPTTGPPGSRQLDTSQPENTYTNPNAGRTQVPAAPPLGKPFRRRDLVQAVRLQRREALLDALVQQYMEAA